MKKSKYFYDIERNMNTTQDNTKIDIDIPHYYIGNNGYEARKVIEGFDLNWNLGNAVTYLLRAYKKHDSPYECIKKAINHLEFELERLKKCIK